MNLTEKAAYLTGLFEGYELDADKKETKILAKLLELVGDMADYIAALEGEVVELREYAEELDEDLGALEEEFYLVDGDDGEYDDDDDYYDDDDDSDFYELQCPTCGEVICFDGNSVGDSLLCPACGNAINDIELCDDDCDNCDGCDDQGE